MYNDYEDSYRELSCTCLVIMKKMEIYYIYVKSDEDSDKKITIK